MRPSSRSVLLALTSALALAASLLVPLSAATPAGSAERTVTLVGSLQSEIGCAGDWMPDCAASHLPLLSGSTYGKNVDLPPGTYDFKVALNDTWDENYGVNGASNGDNYPLVVTAPTTFTMRYDDATHETTAVPAAWAPATTPTAADRALARNSLREPLTRERFYFVMADRFANGDTANDTGGLIGDRDVTGYDPTGKGWYHGGDIAGMTKRISYIKGLGTTAIWLTPSFKNKPVQGSGAGKSAGYHGYWVTDFTQVDPHFGTNAELKTFIDKAHRQGMKVFFDIITNHTADVLGYPDAAYTGPAGDQRVPYVSKADQPYTDAAGVPFDDALYAAGTNGFPAVDETSFPYPPTFLTEADKTLKVPAWLNDPTMYHNRGTSSFAGENSTYGDFPSGDRSALDDLWTERPAVVNGMTDIYKTWVDFGIDGFRIDTVKHVNIEFWQQFAPAMEAEADRIGNRDFFSFGEVFDSGPAYLSSFTTTGKLQATLDFGFQDGARRFDQGVRTTDLSEFFAQDDYYTDADSNAYQLPTFLGNHDMGRVGYFIGLDQADAAPEEKLQRSQMLHSLMYLTRGQPVVYYGDEQGFVGDGGDQDARQDMFASQVTSYNDDAMLGTDRLGSRDRFNRSAPMYRWIADLADLVEEHPALRDGAQIQRYAESEAGIFAVSRIDRRQQVEYVVALNNSEVAKTVQVPTYSAGRWFGGVWPDGLRGGRTGADSTLTVTVPPLSARVWKARAPLARRDAAPAISVDTLKAGSNIGGRAEIGVAADSDSFSQVSFAVRPYAGNAGDWTYLGTDDNAPYRVFQDVTTYPRGTVLEYRAVLKDSSGNLSATSTVGIVGDAKLPKEPVVVTVTVPGSFNNEIGCPADWSPNCAAAHLTLDPADGLWKGTFTIPAGGYNYKVAINDSWAVNYGAGGLRGGADIPLNLTADGPVSFTYDPVTHLVTTTPPSG